MENLHRRLAGTGAALLAVGLAAAPGAGAESGKRTDFSLTLTQTAPSGSTGLNLSAVYRGAGGPGSKPSAITKLEIELPEGFTIDGKAAPRCAASDEELRAQGPAACPAASKLGAGNFTAVTGFGPPFDPFAADNTVFNGPNQLIELITARGTSTTLGLDRITISGTTLKAHPPSTPGGPPDGKTTVRSIDFQLPARRTSSSALFTTPPTCPAGGSWVTRGLFGFADGFTETVVARTPCVSQAEEPGPASRARVIVRPRRAVAGTRTRFRLRARSAQEGCSSGAAIRFAGRTVRTDGVGRAAVTVRVRRAGRFAVRLSKPGCAGAKAWVRVSRP